MGKFKLEQKGTQWHFNLVAGNDEPILRSEMYETKAAAVAGTESVRKNSQREGAFEVKEAKNSDSYFVLKATNGQVVGQSEMYSSTSGCKSGIESVQKNAPDAELVEA